MRVCKCIHMYAVSNSEQDNSTNNHTICRVLLTLAAVIYRETSKTKIYTQTVHKLLLMCTYTLNTNCAALQ